jgi:MFS family permease
VSILGCVTILFLLSRFQGDLTQFTLLMAMMGLIGAGNSAVVYVALVTSWFDRMRGLAIGIAMAGSGVSAIIAPKLMIPYVAEAGWRMGYQALAIVMFVTLPLVLFGAKNKDEEPLVGGRPSMATEGLTLREALHTARFWRLALVMVLTGMGLSGFYSHFVPMVTDRGLDAAQAANAAALFGAAVLAGRLLSGYLLDRIHPPLVATGAWSLAVVCLGALLLPGTPQLYLAGAAVGVAFGTEFDFSGYVTARIFGRRAYGKLFGLLFAIFGVGGLSSPIIYGYVHDRTDSYGYAVALSMVMMAAAIPVVWWLGTYPEPRKS